MIMSKRKNIITKSNMVTIQNAITGEMDTAKVTMIVARDVPKYKNEPFTILFQASTYILGRDITPVACKVLITICGCVDYGNKIGKTQQEIADHIKYSKRNVERAYEELRKANVLYKQTNPVDARMNDWYINAYQSWKGSIIDRKKRIQETNPAQLGLFPELPEKAIKPNKDF